MYERELAMEKDAWVVSSVPISRAPFPFPNPDPRHPLIPDIRKYIYYNQMYPYFVTKAYSSTAHAELIVVKMRMMGSLELQRKWSGFFASP